MRTYDDGTTCCCAQTRWRCATPGQRGSMNPRPVKRACAKDRKEQNNTCPLEIPRITPRTRTHTHTHAHMTTRTHIVHYDVHYTHYTHTHTHTCHPPPATCILHPSECISCMHVILGLYSMLCPYHMCPPTQDTRAVRKTLLLLAILTDYKCTDPEDIPPVSFLVRLFRLDTL